MEGAHWSIGGQRGQEEAPGLGRAPVLGVSVEEGIGVSRRGPTRRKRSLSLHVQGKAGVRSRDPPFRARRTDCKA